MEQNSRNQSQHGSRLPGRVQELELLDTMLRRVELGGKALVVRGQPGIGKSALLTSAIERASEAGFSVLVASGVQVEARLPFAGLHQLIRPLARDMESLPRPQKEALSVAFGAGGAAPPDLFFIALATLNLLSETASRSPILLAIDDAQWIDEPTCDVLVFVARRLQADAIVLLAAVRSGFESSLVTSGLPELTLEALDDEVSRHILDRHAPDLAPPLRERVLQEAAGNPLALVELSNALPHMGDDLESRAWLPLTSRLENAFASRLSELPETTRFTLLHAAVNDGESLTEILSSAAWSLGKVLGHQALEPAVRANLLSIDQDLIRFRHPLVRSAVYQSVTDEERRATHAALAQVLTQYPDRRAWHLALSVVGSDEEVALELEAAAARARSQGAVAVAVSALERAAGLTGNESLRGERYLRAAELALELGQSQVVSRLMERVDGTTLTEKENARLTWLKATTSPEGTGDRLLLSRLIDAAHGMQTAGETALALQLLTAAALRCYYGDPGDDTRDEVVAVLESLGLDDLDSQLILALAFANPIEKCGELLLRLDRLGELELQDAQVLYNLGTAASLLSAFNVASRFLAPASEAVRAQGRLGFLPAVLHCVAWAETHSGNWSVALPAAEETQAIGFEMGQPLFALGALELQVQQAAYRGNPESVTEVIASLKLHLSSTSSVALASITQLSLGLLALSNGDYEDAFTQIRRMFEPGDLVFHFMRCWAIGELAEAAVACGRVDEARACLRDLEAYTKGSPLPWLQAGLAYARPLLAEDAKAEDLYRQSMEADLTRWPFYRGRIMLAYGSWLRRHRRVAESRALLRGARDVLDAAGTVPWANRARSELRAAGESSPNRITATGERLTPQELQIAQLAGRGLSNREIGRQLFLSHRTVGSHLYRIFPKLGITSRWELREVLRE